MEKIKYECIVEHYGMIVEYLAVAQSLGKKSTVHDIVKANTLGWKLAIALPSDFYKRIAMAIVKPTVSNNVLTIVSELSGIYKADDVLTSDEIAHHFLSR